LFLLNLTLGQFLAVFGAASGIVVALYLLDRSRRRVIVATFRFWLAAAQPVQAPRRSKIQQWPSLLLQLLGILLLLLAISQLRLGSRDTSSRDHVLLVDSSAWMTARVGQTQLFDEARAQALLYLRALPLTDRVMLASAGALTVPLTSFESNRDRIVTALARMRPGESSVDLERAIEFAQSMQKRYSARPGEIVFAGAPRVNESAWQLPRDALANLRFLPVRSAPVNVGIRRVGLRRSPTQPELWKIVVTVRNYSHREQMVDLAMQFGGSPTGARLLRLGPLSEQESAFDFTTKAAGLLDVRIRSKGDGFPLDDRAVTELPALKTANVRVCSEQAALYQPLLAAQPNLVAIFSKPAECRPENGEVVIYDRFVPASFAPGAKAILVQPPYGAGPIKTRASETNGLLQSWLPGHPLTAGLHSVNQKLGDVSFFLPEPGDIRVAESRSGPVVVVRDKIVAIGFAPTSPSLRFEIATPLLFANIIQWLEPEAFPTEEVFSESLGAVTAHIAEGTDPSTVRVFADNGGVLPFSIRGAELHFFTALPGSVRVRTGASEQVHSLTLPDVGESEWQPPDQVRRGIPARTFSILTSQDIWYWLALAGGLALLVEWLYYARPKARTA
jgi:hypothetical protein